MVFVVIHFVIQTWIGSSTIAEWITAVSSWATAHWYMVSNGTIGIDTASSCTWTYTITISATEVTGAFGMIETFASAAMN